MLGIPTPLMVIVSCSSISGCCYSNTAWSVQLLCPSASCLPSHCLHPYPPSHLTRPLFAQSSTHYLALISLAIAMRHKFPPHQNRSGPWLTLTDKKRVNDKQWHELRLFFPLYWLVSPPHKAVAPTDASSYSMASWGGYFTSSGVVARDFAPCLQKTPPFLGYFVQPSWL